MTPARRGVWLGLGAILALSGCIMHPAGPPPLAAGRWWQGMGDPPLSELIEHALARATARTALKVRFEKRERALFESFSKQTLSAAIARQYIALRAQQTALVLLAAREDLDARLVVIARQPGGAVPRERIAAARWQLARTQARQVRVRGRLASLRRRLALRSGSASDRLASLAGGPIPLPPPQSALTSEAATGGKANKALRRYQAAQAAQACAQLQASQARTHAALQDLRAQAGTSAAADAIAADRDALDALQTEEDARARMSQAYIALVQAGAAQVGRGSPMPLPARKSGQCRNRGHVLSRPGAI